jgi:hypothetical protein
MYAVPCKQDQYVRWLSKPDFVLIILEACLVTNAHIKPTLWGVSDIIQLWRYVKRGNICPDR